MQAQVHDGVAKFMNLQPRDALRALLHLQEEAAHHALRPHQYVLVAVPIPRQHQQILLAAAGHRVACSTTVGVKCSAPRTHSLGAPPPGKACGWRTRVSAEPARGFVDVTAPIVAVDSTQVAVHREVGGDLRPATRGAPGQPRML